MNVARHLIQGVDLWVNAPRRPLEACGTSGMKALFNGALNCSILDRWRNEAYNGLNGFAIGSGGERSSPDTQDARDADDLYDVLVNQILPLYYNRDARGVPRGWVARMKNALQSLAWHFNAHRMVMDDARKYYLPTAGGAVFDSEKGMISPPITGFRSTQPSRSASLGRGNTFLVLLRSEDYGRLQSRQDL